MFKEVAKDISVIVCVLNEERRLKKCLDSVYENNPGEVILVDGGSKDKTISIANQYDKIKILEGKNLGLSNDRQRGIDNSVNDYIAFIDADHRLKKGDLIRLKADLTQMNLDIIQSGLKPSIESGYWVKSEGFHSKLFHNIPGQKRMIGTAPALYRKSVFNHIKFDGEITSEIDDTDFMYRLSKFPALKIGVANVIIEQEHFCNFSSYLKKFLWYGKGDGQFCIKNPERALSMLFHLLIRYPIIYSFKGIIKGGLIYIPFFILQGLVRLLGLSLYISRYISKQVYFTLKSKCLTLK